MLPFLFIKSALISQKFFTLLIFTNKSHHIFSYKEGDFILGDFKIVGAFSVRVTCLKYSALGALIYPPYT